MKNYQLLSVRNHQVDEFILQFASINKINLIHSTLDWDAGEQGFVFNLTAEGAQRVSAGQRRYLINDQDEVSDTASAFLLQAGDRIFRYDQEGIVDNIVVIHHPDQRYAILRVLAEVPFELRSACVRKLVVLAIDTHSRNNLVVLKLLGNICRMAENFEK